MEQKAMYKLSYGVFVITARDGDRDSGCISNTVFQVTSTPNQVCVCLNHYSFTHDMIKKTREFTVSVLSQKAQFGLVKHFGFQSGKAVSKFAGFTDCVRASNGIYYITKETNAYLTVKVHHAFDLGTHTMFVGEVTDMEVLDATPSATYEYYINNIKDTEETTMTKWICPVCGHVHEGPEAPEECPVCHVRGATWRKMEDNMTLAAEHECGIYAKTVKNNSNVSEEDKKYIFEQLTACSTKICSEVGMYLCLSRIAHREGYPEIGLYLAKIADEKAIHAAKYAELLGEDLEPNIKATTQDNLKWRADCEFGSTQSTYNLASCCKKYDLDALHDTIHEMARDEARFGKALEGMLKRYFKIPFVS